MICYDDLIYIASSLGIEVVYHDIHSKKPLLDGYAIPYQQKIVIEKSLKYTTQGTCVLAEEIGHCLYPPLSNHIMYHRTDYYDMSQWDCDNLAVKVAKEEHQAMFFATNLLIPDKKFWDYYKSGPHTIYEWCEHFGVTEWFMLRKIDFMRSKSIPKRKGSDLIAR